MPPLPGEMPPPTAMTVTNAPNIWETMLCGAAPLIASICGKQRITDEASKAPIEEEVASPGPEMAMAQRERSQTFDIACLMPWANEDDTASRSSGDIVQIGTASLCELVGIGCGAPASGKSATPHRRGSFQIADTATMITAASTGITAAASRESSPEKASPAKSPPQESSPEKSSDEAPARFPAEQLPIAGGDASSKRDENEPWRVLHYQGLKANDEGDFARAYEFFIAASGARPTGASHLISAANMKLKLAEALQAADRPSARHEYMTAWELYQDSLSLPTITPANKDMIDAKLAFISKAMA